MNELVILKSPIMYTVLAVIVAIHIFSAVMTVMKRDEMFLPPMLCAAVVEGLAVALHIYIVFFGLSRGASAEELLLTFLFSGAVGLVAIGVAEKKRKNNGD